MTPTSVITILKRLAGVQPDNVKACQDALEGIESELIRARADFSAADSEFGARLVEALPGGGAAKVEAELEALRLQVQRLERARVAVATRLQAAQEAASDAELDKRWQDTEKALRVQRVALSRFQSAAKDMAVAMLAAEAAGLEAYRLLPVRDGLQPFFTDLTGELDRQLSLATEGARGGYVASALHDIKGQPSLVARADMYAADWLRRRPARLQDTPPEAA